jgi:xylulokinase
MSVTMTTSGVCAIGLDLGTSGVKAVLLSSAGMLWAEASVILEVSRPQPLWSEQNPSDWWAATDLAMQRLRKAADPVHWQQVRALAVAGQMHGAVLLNVQNEVLRPAILWNDGRSQAQCVELELLEPATRRITANRAMAGFTAPKLMWVAQHEPQVFAQVATVLLPKDWLVLKLAGVMSSDCSDAAGTLWLNVAQRAWSELMLRASGMNIAQMPTLHEGPDAVGSLLEKWCRAWGLPSDVRVAAGAGDNAAGAIGVGVVRPGEAFLSLGTSGVIFVATDSPRANPERGVHTFCHAVRNTWHQMAVMLSASSALSWWCGMTGTEPAEVLAELKAGEVHAEAPLFLPYLSGERTPHADPASTGSFLGLTHAHSRGDMSYAVIEGVAFAFADGMAALNEAGSYPTSLLAIGGGSRSDVWLQLLADVLGLPIHRPAGAEVGPALGAARLALMSLGMARDDVVTAPSIEKTFLPDAQRGIVLAARAARFRAAYAPLRALSSNQTD